MLIEKLTLPGGAEFENVPADEQTLTELGVAYGDIPGLIASANAKAIAVQKKQTIRVEIHQTAGDTKSIQGTIADNVGLLLEELGRFMAAATTSSDPATSAAAQPLADALAPLVAAVDAGTCTLTHHVKGTATVVTDACNRANAVAVVLQNHAAP